jgi:hypothetical protein
VTEPTVAEREAIRQRLDRAVQLVLSNNHVRLSPDDPILVVATLLQDFLEHADRHQRDALRDFKLELEVVRSEWETASRHRAETVLNAALIAAREAIDADMHNAANQLSDASAKTLNTTIAHELSGLKPVISQARRLGTLNVIAAVIALFAATVALAAVYFIPVGGSQRPHLDWSANDGN